jgi:threonine dehydratase
VSGTIAATVTPADVEEAAHRLEGRIHRTPLLPFTGAAHRGDRLLLKCENLQEVGAFKARGALNYVLQLPSDALAHGVATYSSGNHGAALSWAAQQVGAAATIFVPEDIAAPKRAAIEGYGGRVVVAGRTSNDRRVACERAQERSGFRIVPPFDDPWIVAGQGTCGLEILDHAGELARVLVPVGGGGLLSGIAVAIKARRPDVEIVGVEPVAAPSMKAALAAGHPVEIAVGETIADGLKPVQVGALTHAIAARLVARVVTVEEAWIRAALRLLFERAKLVVEPSGAATLAAYLFSPELRPEPAHARRGATVVVLSGGNVDLARLPALFEGAAPIP